MVINLEGNRIATIESGGFQGLDKLLSLTLTSNQITRIKRDDFQGLGNLQSLHLLGNQIQTVEGFQGLGNLERLDLSSNQITSVASMAFQGLGKLESIFLGSNRITNLQDVSLHELPNLQDLLLSGNRITNVERHDFQGLGNLMTLSLQGNQITSVDVEDFQSLSRLWRLDLSDNQITKLDDGSFRELGNLFVLYLDGNQMTRIRSDSFQGLSALRMLELDRNPIRHLERGAFKGLDRLGSLSLHDTAVTDIESGAFDGLWNLETLLLNGNLSELNLAEASFGSLRPCQGHFEGFCVGSGTPITTLILDDAKLSRSSLRVILGETQSITDISLIGRVVNSASDLASILSIPTLVNVTVDQAFFHDFAAQLSAFDARPDHTVLVLGDLDSDRRLTVADLDQLADAIRNETNEIRFDLTRDGLVTSADQESWIRKLKQTYFGDANLDGLFHSDDLEQVLQAGQYEDSISGNSSWATGDWQGDGDFTSADIVKAFQDGGYERGPRAISAAIPEPSVPLLSLLASFGLIRSRKSYRDALVSPSSASGQRPNWYHSPV